MVQYKTNSVYSGVNVKSFYVTYLDTFKANPIKPEVNDSLVIIDTSKNERPDLMSYELYGTVDLWWIFALRNPDLILDPIYDFTTGKEIYVPTKQRAFGLVGRK